jgi:Activator of mitotic machinery Cdc14 phosphatase activation C-term
MSQPSPFLGTANRTDNLSVIPTSNDDKKSDKKKKEKDKDSNEHTGGKKSGWGWLLGSEEKEKDKDNHKDPSKKSKIKGIKAAEKPHDNTRLDLLQSSIDGSRGRESLVMDRENIRLEEERKKESIRKSSSGEPKKEKESGIFSFFGGGKKKSDRDGAGRKSSSLRAHSPEPPPRVRKPDIDYNWTRFSILEERAIYRMAHIKLANPRRALYSQVLLSNFMYSYLAKVQQMHPQIQVPQSAAQKNLRLQQQQQEKQQIELKAHAEVAQAYQDQQQHQEDSQYYQYHDVSSVKSPMPWH